MNFITEFFFKESTKKLLFFTLIILCFYVARSLINLFLLTFLFTYLMNSLQGLIVGKFKRMTPAKENLITIALYTLLFVSIVLIMVRYIPLLVAQSKYIITQATDLDLSPNSDSDIIQSYLLNVLQQIDIKSYIKSGFNVTFQLAANVGKWSVNIFIAIMLSLFFILEKKKICCFLDKFKESKASGIYTYLHYFVNNFLNSFGKVIQAQILIALANTILSMIMLYILKFPQLITLGFMIFILSLVPVAGVVISLIPLSLIAFKIGGLTKVVYVLVMIALIHAFESYFLNPKLMSSKTELPIFFTFVILIVSEHFMGTWGLLIGIPLFMFVLDLLNVKFHD